MCADVRLAAPLSQLELDALCIEASDDVESPPSPQDSCLKKRRRRVSLTAMGSEIAALEAAQASENVAGPGLSQEELDKICTTAGDASTRGSSPIASRLYAAKRKRLSVGDGEIGAATRAAEILESTGADFELKQERSPCSPPENPRFNLSIETDENCSIGENYSTLCSGKDLSQAGPGSPTSPCRRVRAVPFSPTNSRLNVKN